MRCLTSTAVLVSASFFSVISSAGTSLPTESRVIAQPSAPVKILSYSASFQSGASSVRAGISHTVAYQNVSGKSFVAVQFSFIAFDVWNEFLDRTDGLMMGTIAPQGTDRGVWLDNTAYADSSFHTGVAYISKVRFDTGEIWEADVKVIVLELKKIEADFDGANLKKREPGK